jgi:hypothetical protein
MEIIEWIVHMDEHLGHLIGWMGGWFYALLAAVIFSETGLVIAPFLPGDSLLFAVGALAARQPDDLSIYVLYPLLVFAAVAGDAANYSIGKWVGPQIFRRDTGWLMNKKHLFRAEASLLAVQRDRRHHLGQPLLAGRLLVRKAAVRQRQFPSGHHRHRLPVGRPDRLGVVERTPPAKRMRLQTSGFRLQASDFRLLASSF